MNRSPDGCGVNGCFCTLPRVSWSWGTNFTASERNAVRCFLDSLTLAARIATRHGTILNGLAARGMTALETGFPT